MNGLNKHIRLRLLDKEHVYKRLWGLKQCNTKEKNRKKKAQNCSKLLERNQDSVVVYFYYLRRRIVSK